MPDQPTPVPTKAPIKARIEVFRPGTFTPMQGEPVSYSAADLKAVADAYDPETAPAPIVVGHPHTDAPAFGWIEKLDYATGPERLVATVGQIEPGFAAMVKDGRFKKVSMSFFRPGQANNPVPGTWYPKHVGFLGAAAPAVSGLKNVAFAEPDGVTFTADFGAGSEAASLFRQLRDFFIDRFGLEDADKVLPAWSIDWLENSDAPPPALTPQFAAASAGPDPTNADPKEETRPVPQPDPAAEPAFAAREASLAVREQAIAARESAAIHAEHVAFAEQMIEEGRLLPASRDRVVALLDALPNEASVAFAEGGAKLAPAAALREVLAAQPSAVSFGAADLGEASDAADRPVAFAADGKPVDREGLALHRKALAFQRAHPDADYITAVKAVSED